MKERLRQWFTNPKVLAVLAILVVAAVFLLSSNTLKLLAFWVGILLLAALLVMLAQHLIHKLHARKMSDEFGDALLAPGSNDADMNALRDNMRDAIKSIKGSRLGQTKGREALYELPWYMIIGNPAAGKSTAIANSGLKFPFAEEHGTIIQGIGGTRNCDWYFTSEGIILDTAGRYSVHSENRGEWLGFLDLLRKHRPRAPINGIIVAASIAELTSNRPEFIIDLAKKLRNRVQELTEYLEVIPPIYVVFTKMDLVAGFNEFFSNLDDAERNRVWGATLPFRADGNDNMVADFDRYFDELSEGLKEMSLAQISLQRGQTLSPGMLTLPLEFKGLRSSLRTFISTLFEENPFQFRPVFRGFYFTSSLQEPETVHTASTQISKRFHLADATATDAEQAPLAVNRSYFLLDLFRKVMFADKQLVRQYSSKQRKHTRYALLAGSALALSLIMGGWAWSYTNNRQLVSNVEADLKSAVAIQQGHVDLSTRLKALLILQDRLQQLQQYHVNHPLMLGLGLYQGDQIEAKLRAEYFAGMQQIMLTPVTENLETYLGQVVAKRDQLQAVSTDTSDANTSNDSDSDYQAPSATNTEQAYNALKAYLMLNQHERVEPVMLAAQLTRFWRGWLSANRGMMSRNDMITDAQQLMTFYVSQYNRQGWPQINTQPALVADTRSALQRVMSGMSAVRRVYAQIKARAATRFAPMTVASILGDADGQSLVTGSYAIPGSFTHEAWGSYVKDAIRNAANNELSVKDWVLETDHSTDLTLTGSPEQIQQQLIDMYKADYVSQWQKFLRGVGVQRFANFQAAVDGMNKLGDPQSSPLEELLHKVYAETSWDNPSPLQQGLNASRDGVIAWIKGLFINRAPDAIGDSTQDVDVPGGSRHLRAGVIGRHFTGVTHLMLAKDSEPALFDGYMQMLAELRTALNQINTQGTPGPGARQLMEQTLGSGGESPLSKGLQLVDQHLLDGLDSTQRSVLRPLLLRPLMQTFAALVIPVEQDINSSWKAQVYDPFNQALAGKYPFDPDSNMQATAPEMAQIFGPTGAIAKFAIKDLGPLINQRGDVLTPKQWADMGISLSPSILANFGRWTAPLDQAQADSNKTVFQIRPGPAAGRINGYTIDINGQKLHYINTPPKWYSFVWGGANPTHTTQVSATTRAGNEVTVEQFSGAGALGKLFQAASGKADSEGVYSLTWSHQDILVSVQLRIISSPQMNGNGTAKAGLGGKLPAQVAGASNTPTLAMANAEETH